MIWILKIFKWFAIGLVSLIILTLVGGRTYQVVSESDDLARYPGPGEMIDVDGHLMHINCIGEGSPTLILELGVGSASFSWYDIHKQLSEITRTCAYDRAGLGYSDSTSQPKRATDVAERLHRLLRNAGIDDELVLVGWSAGGVYVRELYRRYPERVVGMLLVDSSHEQQARRLPPESGGGADPALNIAKHLAPFGLVRLSGLLEQRVASSRASDEAKAYLRVTYHLSHSLETVSQESDAFNFDINADQPPSTLGDLPLIVLTRGISDASQREREAQNQLQQELTLLSTNGKQIIASESGHHIYADQPELLIESIEELVRLVRERQLLE
jgi:pimeloyl-ACP methyl ester carboxylesterase